MNEEQLKIKITAEIGDLKKKVAEANKTMSGFAEKNIKDMGKFQSGIQKAGEVAKKGFAVAAKSIAAVGTALLAVAPATKEFREGQAKLATAFETAGSSAQAATDTYNSLYRVLGDSDVSVEAANHLAKLTNNQKDLSTWTNICQGVYATFGDSLPIEGLTEAANETAKTGQLTGSLADALNWCGIAEDEFQEKLDATNSEAEREKLIRETLNGAYSEAAANYEENAAAILAQNEANAKMQASMAALGEVMTPINTMLTELGATILADLTPYIQEFGEKYMPQIQEALSGIGEAVGKVITFIAEHWELISTIAVAIGAIAAAIALVSTALTVYNTVMAISAVVSAPIIAIIAAITIGVGLLAAGVLYCVRHWDELKEGVINVVNTIKEKVTDMVEKVKAKFEALKAAIAEKVAAIKNAIVEKFTAIRDGVVEKVTAVKDKVVSIFTNIKSGMEQKVQAAKSAVLGVFDGIKTGIKEKIEAARDFVHGAIERIKGFFNFHWELPKIKLPHFSIKGKFSLDPPSIPHFSVSWYARGGVFDKPNLFGYGNGNIGGLGENGAEAVVPLEKNTQWLDKIADKLASRQGSRPIVLEVDGRVFAQVSCDTINDLTRQTGSLPIRVI